MKHTKDQSKDQNQKNNTGKETTDFGFARVTREEKTEKVQQVFSSVAGRYDLMNDLMSLGIHRLWKYIFLYLAGLHKTDRILDLAGGTGDLAIRIMQFVAPEQPMTLADSSSQMLQQARKRLMNQGLIGKVQLEQVSAENMPFTDACFDKIIIGFGFRNFTDKNQALSECFRVLKPGGKLLILEFSQLRNRHMRKVYDLYSYHLLPKLGKWLVQDEQSYQYLVESIRRHPAQEAVVQLLQDAGFVEAQYYNMSGGIVAAHSGIKP